MNPTVLFENTKLPIEIIDEIHSYSVNNIAYKALQEHFQYILYEQELYESFCHYQYVLPNCYCSKVFRNSKHFPCHFCEYEDYHFLNSYEICILDNDQYQRIRDKKV